VQELNLLLPDSQLVKAGVCGLASSRCVIPLGLGVPPAETIATI